MLEKEYGIKVSVHQRPDSHVQVVLRKTLKTLNDSIQGTYARKRKSGVLVSSGADLRHARGLLANTLRYMSQAKRNSQTLTEDDWMMQISRAEIYDDNYSSYYYENSETQLSPMDTDNRIMGLDHLAFSLLDSGYVDNAVALYRRLMDKEYKKTSTGWGVASPWEEAKHKIGFIEKLLDLGRKQEAFELLDLMPRRLDNMFSLVALHKLAAQWKGKGDELSLIHI